MSNLNLNNHSDCCRLCLISFGHQVARFDFTDLLKKTFFRFTNLNLDNSENLSKFICSSCHLILTEFAIHRFQFIQKQNELQEFLKNNDQKPENIKVEPDDLDFENIVKSSEYVNVKSECEYERLEEEEDQDYLEDFEPNFHHEKQKPQIKTYHCSWCTRSFINEKLLNNHRLNKHKEKLTTLEIREIRGRKKNERKLVCPQCGIATHYLNDHINKYHLNIKRFFCDSCPFGSFRKCEMKLHQYKHRKSPQFICDFDGTRFKRKNALHVHMNSAHISAGPLICCYCQKHCKNKMALWQHNRLYHADGATLKENCQICDKSILVKYMRKHIRLIHEVKDEKQLCGVCGKILPNKRSMVHHKRIHKERIYVCKYENCTKKYFKESHLVEHEKTHINQREYKCTYAGCNKSYFKPRVLKMHIALTHENFKHPCPVPACKFSVGRRDYMKVHLKKHTELGTHLLESLLEQVKQNTDLW